MKTGRAFRAALLLASITLTIAGASAQTGSPPADGAAETPVPVNPRWLDRLDQLDRALLDELVGFAPPAFTPDLTWIGGAAQTWADLRGKVVVLQSWSNRTTAARRPPAKLIKVLSEFGSDDVAIILLHTPDGADGLQRFLERRSFERPVVLDARGQFCNALGVYKRPVNIVVDRNGTTRFVGLNHRGLGGAVAALVEEPADPAASPAVRPAPEAEAPAEYPPITGTVSNALDFRGKSAPAFHVARWITPTPNASGKVVVLDFWATWCGPCVASIPHMNELADAFTGRACMVGISDESSTKFDRGLEKKNLKERDFHYALALDSSSQMKRAMQIAAIPHCVVISSDWIVRWQGHPQQLTSALLGQIIAADAGGDRGRSARSRRDRWPAPR